MNEVEYFGNQPWPLPASLMVGFRARTRSREINVDGAEIEEARWFTRDQMRADLEAGRVIIPTGVSISSSLLEHWYGGPLAGRVVSTSRWSRTVEARTSSAVSFSLTCASDGFVCAVPSV